MAIVKVILLCGGRLALPALKELAFNQMLAAVVIPSHCNNMLEEVKTGLAGSGIPIAEVTKENFEVEIIKAIETYKANLGLMITFSFLLPISVFGLPKHGFYNVHPGPLPAYRGSDPIFQQIKNREKYAGATLHFVDGRFDTGPIFTKEMIRLDATDTYGTLTTKLANVCVRLVMVLIKLIGFETVITAKQQDATKSNYYKKQTEKDVIVNWETMDCATIIALMNACNPWNKGAITKINNNMVRLLSANNATNNYPASNYLPGTIVLINKNGLLVSTIKNELLLVTLISAEEGFLHTESILKLGYSPEQRFENIY